MRTSVAGASSVHCPVHAPRSRRRFVHHVARLFAEHLVGLCKDRLSIDITSGAPQPASPCGALRHTLSGRVRGPSSWFLPTSTVCATGRFAGLLHPAADHEVHRVSAPAVPSRFRVGRSGAFPPMLALQSIPLLRSCIGVTADRCPLALQAAACWPRGLAPRKSPLRPAAVADRASPVALLGFPFWSINSRSVHSGCACALPSWTPLRAGPFTLARAPSWVPFASLGRRSFSSPAHLALPTSSTARCGSHLAGDSSPCPRAWRPVRSSCADTSRLMTSARRLRHGGASPLGCPSLVPPFGSPCVRPMSPCASRTRAVVCSPGPRPRSSPTSTSLRGTSRRRPTSQRPARSCALPPSDRSRLGPAPARVPHPRSP